MEPTLIWQNIALSFIPVLVLGVWIGDAWATARSERLIAAMTQKTTFYPPKH